MTMQMRPTCEGRGEDLSTLLLRPSSNLGQVPAHIGSSPDFHHRVIADQHDQEDAIDDHMYV